MEMFAWSIQNRFFSKELPKGQRFISEHEAKYPEAVASLTLLISFLAHSDTGSSGKRSTS